jgi:hypothetical protein
MGSGASLVRDFGGGGGDVEDEGAGKDLFGFCSTSCKAFLMALRSKPA